MKALSWFETKFSPISQNYIIKSIRQGLIYNMPLIMIGAFAVMMLNLPIMAVRDGLTTIFGENWRTVLLAMHKGTFRIMAISTIMGVSFCLIKNHKLTKISTQNPIIAMLCSLSCYIAVSAETGVFLSESAAGPKGIFPAIIVAIISVNIFVFLQQKLPSKRKLYAYDADAILLSSLSNILPATITVLLFAAARTIFDITGITAFFASFSETLNSMFIQSGNGLASSLLYILLSHIMWFFGIHGTNVLEGVSSALFSASTDINLALVASGLAPTQIFTKEFLDVFVFMGGAGSTLGLLFSLLLSKQTTNDRSLAKYSLFPGIFNINESMVYGLPIIFNPFYLIPFLITPLLLCLTSYAAFTLGLVPLTTAEVVWTTPIFLSGYISTGSFSGVILQVFNFALSILIYMPFIRLQSRQVTRTNIEMFKSMTTEYNTADPDNPPQMLTRSDEKGILARGLATEIRAMLDGENTGIYMAYQPKSRSDGSVFGAEALIRWEHPVYGFVSPAVILGIAEEADLTLELGTWTLKESFAHLKEWHNQGYMLTLSVNMTPKQIKEDLSLPEIMREIISKHNLDPKYMELELTEHVALSQSHETQRNLEQIKALGISIAVDDFGMGSSSMLYLRDFHANVVKLDISLVQSLHTNAYSEEIVRSTIALCKQLNATVVAEGVELKEHVERLTELGCDRFQGWYFSKALPNIDFLTYVTEHGWALASEDFLEYVDELGMDQTDEKITQQ